MQTIVNEGWQKVDTVVIATFGGYWDALSASALAGKYDAPILLTGADTLSDTTAAEIKRLGAKQAIIVGGTAAVSSGVERQLRGMGLSTQRYAGGDAQQTAIAIAEQVAAGSDTCIVATSNGYWDALAASPYAYAKETPIYLTDFKGRLSAETLAAIKAGGFAHAVIAGGTSAVSSRTEGDLKKAGIADVKRAAGDDAVQTSLELAKWAISQGMSADHMGVATTDGFWDALAGGPLLGRQGGVLVLANDNNVSNTVLPAANKAKITRAYIFGGEAALEPKVMNAFEATTR